MKKIINGKLYDTDTAKELDCYANTYDTRDFRWFRETLYRKKTGEYFLHGEGGPMSKYSRTIGQNPWSGGEEIRPLSMEDATAWAEKHMDADAYQAEFGEIVEDDSRELVAYQIKASNAERLRRASRSTGKTIAQVLDELIEGNL